MPRLKAKWIARLHSLATIHGDGSRTFDTRQVYKMRIRTDRERDRIIEVELTSTEVRRAVMEMTRWLEAEPFHYGSRDNQRD